MPVMIRLPLRLRSVQGPIQQRAGAAAQALDNKPDVIAIAPEGHRFPELAMDGLDKSLCLSR